MADDSRIASILGDWIEQRDRGEEVAPEEVIAAHPEFADELRRQFRALSLMEDALSDETGSARLYPMRDGRYGDYKVAGEGGMGIVYWALDTDLNRQVAFKIVKPQGDGGAETPSVPLELLPPGNDTPASKAFETLKARFLQEAWVTAGLEHPGIVPVYELGETAEGVPYYTMRFVRGSRTLASAIEEATDMDQRLALLEPFLKVCDTIRYAHAHGVIHRDLKPENVAIGEFGEVVVLDWGLAKLTGQEDAAAEVWQERLNEYREATDLRTVAGALGTPGYMSLEAALGEVDEVDERSDVYSLGAILYQLLTGKLPHTFTSYGQMVGVMLEETPVPAHEVDPQIPVDLSMICASALAREKAARFASAGELAEALRRWQRESAVAREVRELLAKAEAAYEGTEGLSGGALLKQLDRVTTACSRIEEKQADHARAGELRSRCEEIRERAIAETTRAARRKLLKRVTILVLVGFVVASAVVAWMIEGKRKEAEEARAAAEAARKGEAQALEDVTATLARAYAHLSGTLEEKGRWGAMRLATALALHTQDSRAGQVALGASATTRAPTLRRFVPGTSAYPLTMSPDGKLLFSAGSWDHSIRVWHVEEHRVVGILRGHTAPATSLAITADGQRLYSAGGDRAVRVWDLESGKLADTWDPEDQTITAMTLEPGESRLWTGSADGSICGWDAASGRKIIRFQSGGKEIKALGLAPGRDRIAVTALGGDVRVHETETGELILKTHTRAKSALSADGKSLFTHPGASVRKVNLGSGEEEKDRSTGSINHVFAFNTDRTWFACFDRGPNTSISVRPLEWDRTSWRMATLWGEATSIDFAAGDAFIHGAANMSQGARESVLYTASIPVPGQAAAFQFHFDGNTAEARALTWTSGGRMLRSVDASGNVCTWDIESGLPFSYRPGLAPDCSSFVFASDGETLVGGGNKGTIRVWDVDTGEVRWLLEGHKGAVTSMVVSPDQKTLYSACSYGKIRVWDLETGAPLESLIDFTGGAYAMTFSSDGRRLFSGDSLGGIQVWDVATGRQQAAFSGHVDLIYDLAVSPDGRWLYSAGNDRTARIWDLQGSGEPIVLTGHHSRVTRLVLSPDGRRLYTATEDGMIRSWDAQSGAPVAVLDSHRARIWCMLLSRDGRRLYSAGGDGLERDFLIREWSLWGGSAYVGELPRKTFALAKDASRALLWPSGERHTLGDFDPASGSTAELAGAEAPPYGHVATAFSPDRERVYFAASKGQVGVCVLSEGVLRIFDRTGPSEHGHVSALATAPDGKRIFSAHEDGTLVVRDSETGEALFSFPGNEQWPRSLLAHPDGRRLVVGCSDGTVRVWDLVEREVTARFEGGGAVMDLILSADGSRLYAAGGIVLVIDLETNTALKSILLGTRPNRLALPREGRYLFASGQFDPFIKGHERQREACPIHIWDLVNGEHRGLLFGHRAEIDSLAVTPDGKRLVSSAWDNMTRVWDVPWLLMSTEERLAEAERRYGLRVEDFTVVPLSRSELLGHHEWSLNRRLRSRPLSR